MAARGLQKFFASLFHRSRKEQYLERYVVREYGRGRALDEIMNDAYVRNRSTPEQQARLLDSPEVVAAIGAHAVREMRLAATAPR